MTEPTSPTDGAARRDRRGGFTLLELTLALAVMALVAGLALPRIYPGGGSTSARAAAYSVAAILRSDRNAALSGGAATVTRIDEKERRITGGGGSVAMPDDLELDLKGSDGPEVRFYPDGRSSGAAIVLTRSKSSYTVRVDPITGGVMILSGAL